MKWATEREQGGYRAKKASDGRLDTGTNPQSFCEVRQGTGLFKPFLSDIENQLSS
jgi:hypothetical protein